jgi:hypothetical protein
MRRSNILLATAALTLGGALGTMGLLADHVLSRAAPQRRRPIQSGQRCPGRFPRINGAKAKPSCARPSTAVRRWDCISAPSSAPATVQGGVTDDADLDRFPAPYGPRHARPSGVMDSPASPGCNMRARRSHGERQALAHRGVGDCGSRWRLLPAPLGRGVSHRGAGIARSA